MKYLRNNGKIKPKKEPVAGDLEDQPVPKRPKLEFKQVQFPLVHHPPSIPAGEDSSSNSRNQKLLIMEDKKINTNKHKISVLMVRTFAFRRADIMKNSQPIKDVLKVYPSLRRVNEVRHNFSNHSSSLDVLSMM